MPTKYTIIFIVLLLAVGIFSRLYQPGKYAFGFDQIQILTNAETIAGGNLTLLGPRTGPAEMFTGPLIYYITAVFLFFIPAPWVLVTTSLSISLATILLVYWMSLRYFSKEVGLGMILLWSFSPLLLFFDRIVWNPNLTILSSALVLFPLIALLEKKTLKKLDVFFVFAGVFLGFQAHFSGLLLLPLFIFLQVVWRRLHLPSILAGVGGLVCTLLPTLVFDLRNNWLNLRGLASFLANKDEVHNTLHIFRVVRSAEVTLENFGSIFSFHWDSKLTHFLGVLLLLGAINSWVKKRNRTSISVALAWTATVFLSLSFYSSSPPEYYYFISLPALLLLLLLQLPSGLLKKTSSVIWVLSLCALFSVLTLTRTLQPSLYAIGNQLALAQDLARKNTETPIQSIVYDLKPVNALGVEFFISRLVTPASTGSTVHIVDTAPYSSRYGVLGAWFDPRTNSEHNYITTSQFILDTTTSITLLETQYEGSMFGSHRVFEVVQNGLITGEKLVVVESITDPLDPGSQTLKDFKSYTQQNMLVKNWGESKYNDTWGFVQHHEDFSLFYVPVQFNSQIIPENLAHITAHTISPKPLY
jgi:hypothetical protein